MLFKKKKNPNTRALRTFNSDHCLDLISCERQIMSFTGHMSQPFANVLSISSNIDMAITTIPEGMPKCASHDLYASLKESQRDMKMILRNFDILASRQCMQAINEEKKANPKHHRHPHDLVKIYLYSLTFENDSMREWVKDSSERIYIAYVKFRQINSLFSHQYPKLEDLLYYATTGYIFDRSELLYKTNLSQLRPM